MNRLRIILPLVAILAAAPGIAAAQTTGLMLQERVARIERILENQAGSDLMLQLQQVQQELQELRGLVETQRFEIQKLKRAQRDQYLDIDARLGGASDGAGTSDITVQSGAIDAGGQDLLPPPGTAPVDPLSAPPPASSGVVGIPSLPSPETAGGSERDGYTEAFDLLKERKYPEAAAAFNDLLKRFPQGQYTDNARYWLGEIYYVQRNYPAALAEFDRLVRLHPASPKVPGAMLKIGYIQYEQEDFDQARTALKQVVQQYPTSTEARLAKSRLQRMSGERR